VASSKHIKNLLPPAVVRGLRQAFSEKGKSIRFTGNYKSWEEAQKESTGYAAPEILEKTRAALLKVKAGEAAFERDSATFDVMQYEFPVLAGLLRTAVAERGRLSVLDFGGSLGGTYFQCRKFLSTVKDLRWCVVDQPAHVACGEADFANEQLRFYRTVEECLRAEQPNVLLLSSVIQYLPEPYRFLENMLEEKIPYVIIERTAFTRSGRDRLTVQHVPAWLYNASYPAWFLSEPSFRKIFAIRYELACEYAAKEELHPDGEKAVFKGFQFELIEPAGHRA
jgi:putative methyltransferase (TIGR04325 family)